ncbi:MAG: prepilin-type N-terminal cleavage/methylation domain-containing protein, partial [Gemmatimonadales bacterium]
MNKHADRQAESHASLHLTPPLTPAVTAAVAGFTIIEILVVIVVIAVLAALVAPNVFGHVGLAKDVRARRAFQPRAAAELAWHDAGATLFIARTLARLLQHLNLSEYARPQPVTFDLEVIR